MGKHQDAAHSEKSRKVGRVRTAWYQFMTTKEGVTPPGFESNSGLTIAADITRTFARRTTAHGLPTFYWARGKRNLDSNSII